MNIREYIGGNNYAGKDVGIEIEVEGASLPTFIRDKFWVSTEDGSLRGEALEYVLKAPIPIDEVGSAVDHLNDKFVAKGAVLDFSFRTSVHIHVNVGELEYDQLLAFMYGYLLLEEPLMNFCGKPRKGNRFCLRLQDAEGLNNILRDMFSSHQEGLMRIPQDQYRYAAMNIDALRKFGSLEFRGMRGTNEKAIIETWAKALVHLRNFCAGLENPYQVYEAFAHFGPVAFLNRALGDVSHHFHYPRLANDVRQSFSISLDLPYAYKDRAKQKEEEVEAMEFDFDDNEVEFAEGEEW